MNLYIYLLSFLINKEHGKLINKCTVDKINRVHDIRIPLRWDFFVRMPVTFTSLDGLVFLPDSQRNVCVLISIFLNKERICQQSMMNSTSIESILLPTSHRPERRNSRNKDRSVSSLTGMFETETTTTVTTTATPEQPSSLEAAAAHRCESVSSDEEQDRQELLSMTRKLRQAKRRLFLKSAIQPTNSVDRFRDLLLRISSEEKLGSSSGGSSTCSMFRTRSVSFDDSIQE